MSHDSQDGEALKLAAEVIKEVEAWKPNSSIGSTVRGRNDYKLAKALLAALTVSEIAPWKPMWEFPKLTGRTEFLFRKEWTGQDGKVRASHEVLLAWPDGVLTDAGENVIPPEEMPTHWRPI